MACDLCANSRPGAQKRAVRGFIAGDCSTSSRNPACYKRYPESQTSASTNEPDERIDECATRAHRRMRKTSAWTKPRGWTMSVQSSNEVQSMHRNAVSGEPEAEHRAVHRRLCEYARHRSALDAAEAFDLVRAEQFKLYALHGCATHLEYMERILGYGPHAARERMRVARALVRLPETTAALARGELSYSAARELTRVATDETETAWLARAKGLVVHQIERLVANHQLGDRPDDPPNPSLRPRVV